MSQGTLALVNLTGGEVTPLLDARVDLGFYANACRRLENFMVLPQGGASRRPGTRFVAAAKSHGVRLRLVPFEFSTLQAYVLEFGDRTMRIYKDRGQITVAANGAVVINGTFDSGLAGWTNVSSGGGSIVHDSVTKRVSLIQGGGIGAVEQAVNTTAPGVEHVLRFTVARTTRTLSKVQLYIGAVSGGSTIHQGEYEAGEHCVAFTPGVSPFYLRFRNPYSGIRQVDSVDILSGTALEMRTPWSEADLAALRFAQSADVMFLVHGAHEPMKLSRLGHTTWSLTNAILIDGPYLDENADGNRTLTPSGTIGSITVTANGFSLFGPLDVNRLIRLRHGTTWGWGEITGYTSATQVQAYVLGTLGGTAPTTAWRLGLYGPGSGYPRAVKFYEERLLFAGAAVRPQRIDGSRSSDFETFTPGVDASDPFAYSIATDQANPIQWLVPTADLLIGTAGAPFRARGDSENAPITPTNVQIKRQTRRGCAPVEPAAVDNAVLYLGRDERTLFEFAYQIEANGYVAQDMTVRAEHIGAGGIRELTWHQHPWNCLWAVRADGTLLGFTYLREQQVTAWHRHLLGGDGDGPAAVESVAVIPGAQTDELWLVVRRGSGAGLRRSVELLEAPLAAAQDQVDALHLDAAITYDGRRQTTLAWTASGPAERSFTAAAASFAAGDLGREIHIRRLVRQPDGDIAATVDYRGTITAFVSATVVRAAVAATVPETGSAGAGEWGLAATTVSGAGHLDPFATAVRGLADGAPVAVTALGGGAYDLPRPALVAHLGLPFVSRLQPMRLDQVGASGTAQGRRKRIDRVTVRLHRTATLKAGRDGQHLDPIEFRRPAAPTDLPPPLYTGDKELVFRGDWDAAGDMLLICDEPLPCTVLGLFPRIAINDG